MSQDLLFHTSDDWLDFDQFMMGCFIEDDTSNILRKNLSEIPEAVDSDGCAANEFYVILDKPYQYYEHDHLDQFVVNRNARRYSALKEACKKIDVKKFDLLKSLSNITFIQVYENDIPKIKVVVSVLRNFEICISVHGTRLSLFHEIYDRLPQYCVTAGGVEVILRTINQYNICVGNPDEHLQTLIPNVANFDTSEGPKLQGLRDTYSGTSTIRSTSCQLLVASQRCKDCQRYRGSLRKMSNRKTKSTILETPLVDWKSSKINNAKLTEDQKLHKIRHLHTFASTLKKENIKLKKAVDRQVKKSGMLQYISHIRTLKDCHGYSESDWSPGNSNNQGED